LNGGPIVDPTGADGAAPSSLSHRCRGYGRRRRGGLDTAPASSGICARASINRFAKEQGMTRWFTAYFTRIARVERDY